MFSNIFSLDQAPLPPFQSFSETVRSSCCETDSLGNSSTLNCALLKHDIISLFGPGENNVFQCAYSLLNRLLQEHGLLMGSRSIPDARYLLCYHLVTGMCSAQAGERCKKIAYDLSQNMVKRCILEYLSLLCQRNVLSSTVLRLICIAVGVSLPVHSSVDDCLHCFANATVDTSFYDLPSFFTKFDTASKEYVYQWTSAHGLYPSGNRDNTKFQLLKHVLLGECHQLPSNTFHSACHSIRMQIVQSFDDADKMAFVLSVICAMDKIRVKTLRLVAHVLTGIDCNASHRTVVQEHLRSFLFSLRRGRAVFFSVVQTFHCHRQFSN
jgi:hypothetical protein